MFQDIHLYMFQDYRTHRSIVPPNTQNLRRARAAQVFAAPAAPLAPPAPVSAAPPAPLAPVSAHAPLAPVASVPAPAVPARAPAPVPSSFACTPRPCFTVCFFVMQMAGFQIATDNVSPHFYAGHRHRLLNQKDLPCQTTSNTASLAIVQDNAKGICAGSEYHAWKHSQRILPRTSLIKLVALPRPTPVLSNERFSIHSSA